MNSRGGNQTAAPRIVQLRAAKRNEWAYFKREIGGGNQAELRVRVRFWGLMSDGQIVGLVSHENGMLPAKEFPNFLRYSSPEGEYVQPQ